MCGCVRVLSFVFRGNGGKLFPGGSCHLAAASEAWAQDERRPGRRVKTGAQIGGRGEDCCPSFGRSTLSIGLCDLVLCPSLGGQRFPIWPLVCAAVFTGLPGLRSSAAAVSGAAALAKSEASLCAACDFRWAVRSPVVLKWICPQLGSFPFLSVEAESRNGGRQGAERTHVLCGSMRVVGAFGVAAR